VGRLIPIVDWLPRYDRAMLRGDVLAGLAVTAMIVPKDLGYAGIAGVPVQNGLYAAAAGATVYALFCTSRHISTGPSSALATVAGGAVLFTGSPAPAPPRWWRRSLVTGALFLLLALLRLGWVAHSLARRGDRLLPERRWTSWWASCRSDRYVELRRQRLAGVRVVGAVAWRHQLDDGPGGPARWG
jgi:hypothetical protein